MFLKNLCVEGSPIHIVEVGGCKIGKSTDGLPDVASQKDRQLELRVDPLHAAAPTSVVDRLTSSSQRP